MTADIIILTTAMTWIISMLIAAKVSSQAVETWIVRSISAPALALLLVTLVLQGSDLLTGRHTVDDAVDTVAGIFCWWG